MSKFFIERPVLANVMAVIIVLLGVVCLYTLPVSQYPPIVPPTIQFRDVRAAEFTQEIGHHVSNNS